MHGIYNWRFDVKKYLDLFHYHARTPSTMWEVIGIIAAACCTGGLIPQIIRGIRTKSLNDVSPWLLGLLLLGTTLWFLYGLHLGDKIIMGANVMSFLMAAIILYLRVKYQTVRERQIKSIKRVIKRPGDLNQQVTNRDLR
ncbi:MAG: hypothetical protein A2060_01300 [Planctomycetes bacterium GWA2_50_13]|nr:MAG: hypothetical protein A2060_01300 [Planctomycetes bacterium GWA2_50_13]OHB91985.1 MAG: hypothetical protein A3E75_01565 [Planctomycetes bacterium RIFCSPHIGHO2_12_FULL_51_37]OHB95426.1 MAG: hypothetical protein A3I59_04885 [Planctomycetes bacterium RIFCSPLOWO2_02_FULL_50_16]